VSADVRPVEHGALSGRAWISTLVSVWFAQLACMTGFAFAFPFMPFYIRDLGVEGESAQRYWAGIVTAAPALTMMLTAPLWGVLADRYGRKLMVMRAMFGGAVVIGLMGLAGSVWVLLALRLVQGCLTGTVSATNALVSGVTPRRRVGFSLGLIQTAVFAGSAIGPLVGGMCADRVGYAATFLVAGGFLLAGGVLVAALAKEPARDPHPATATVAPQAEGLWSVLMRPGFAVVIGTVFLLQFAGTVLGPVFPLYVETLVRDKSVVNTETGRLLSVTALCAACAAVPLGWVSDRLGPRRILVLGTLVSGLLMFPQAYVHQVGNLYALRVALGFALGGIGPAMGGFVNRAVPRASQGKAFGVVQSATSLGFGMGPVVGGAVGALFGLRAPFIAVGAMQAVFAAVAWVVLRRVEAAPSARPAPAPEPAPVAAAAAAPAIEV
jgi:DHA1 family multidrug resistance protein-like MFS transporter